MGDLLIRDVSEETKRKIAVLAAEHGRSQSAEARALLDEAVERGPAAGKSWIVRFFESCQADGGFDFELPERSQPRDPDVWWLDEGDAAGIGVH